MKEVMTSADIDPTPIGPDAKALYRDLRSAAFTYGADARWWREMEWAFPNIGIVVAAAARDGAPDSFLFQFECTNYPQQAPLAQPWDSGVDQPLSVARRPFGRDRVGVVFRRDWEGGRYLYTPLDRYALQTHPDWPVRHPTQAWNQTKTIADYLYHLHDLLNSQSYTGLACP